jgi:predicted unusual protein kinase regulating ubiquinone biosynthesis (AarF/ABC1/UbiB family)
MRRVFNTAKQRAKLLGEIAKTTKLGNSVVKAKDKVVPFLAKHYKAVATVAVGGGILSTYMYFNSGKIYVNTTAHRFSRLSSYNAKKQIYMSLPDPPDINLISHNTDTKLPETIMEWGSLVATGLQYLDGNFLQKKKEGMVEDLITHIQNLPTLDERIIEYQQIIKDKHELKRILEEELAREIKLNKYISTITLDKITVNFEQNNSFKQQLLSYAIAAWPVAYDRSILISILKGEQNVTDLLSKMNPDIQTSEWKQFKKNINRLANEFRKFDKEERKEIITNAFTHIIESIRKNPNNISIFDTLIETQLASRLPAADTEKVEDMKKDFINGVKQLPSHILAKMLVISMNNKLDKPSLLSGLFSCSGPVTIKLGQLLSETQEVPVEYRTQFANLKDNNKSAGLIDFYRSIPTSLKTDIDQIGKCLGTGSVKQVHIAKLKDGKTCAINCTKAHLEDQANLILTILQKFPKDKYSILATQLREIVFNEINLYQEYKTNLEMTKKLNLSEANITIPKVFTVTPNCIIREVADGKTLEQLSKEGLMDNILIDKIGKLHRSIIHYAFVDRFVLSDLHFGNIAYCSDKLNIFDWGQNCTLKKRESTAIMWLLVALSDPQREKTFKSSVVAKIAYSGISNKQIINFAYDKCVNGTNMKSKYMIFLNELKSHNVQVPTGYFAVAKMLDCLIEQEKQLKIEGIVQDEMAKIFKKQLGYTDAAWIGINSIFK